MGNVPSEAQGHYPSAETWTERAKRGEYYRKGILERSAGEGGTLVQRSHCSPALVFLLFQYIMPDFTSTPDWTSLPAPEDDGAAKHLNGMQLPSVPLVATDSRRIDLSTQPGRVVVYAYPRTGVPDTPNPDGWDDIPGARGCTPQSCAFRDHYAELKILGISAVFGLSTQDTGYQREAADRLHLPFPLLSDERLELTHALTLPTFRVSEMVLLKRLTLIIRDGIVEHVFYPVYPPDRNADDVLNWLAQTSS